MDVNVNSDRLWQSLMQMAEIGALPNGGCGRLALTDLDRQGRDLFVSWCRDAGCSIDIDDMGNIFARRPGLDETALPVATGSHLDTQPHGGKFDGIYGVLAGLEVIRTLNDHGIDTVAPIETVVWTNEEGSRFAPAMLSSGVYAGLFEKSFAYDRKDGDGLRLEDELRRIGYLGGGACGAHAMDAFLEVHIEQGPILEREDTPIGIVVGGQGQRWYDITLHGSDAHVGSTPMPGRRDALVGAGEVIGAVRRIALEHPPYAVGTVGSLEVSPNSRNTIPGRVDFTVDLRHPDDSVLERMGNSLRDACAGIAQEEGLTIDLDEIWHNPPVAFDADCIAAVREAAGDLGVGSRDMVSGAGHDACMIARKVPTSMIFIPCAGGVSHNEAESAEPEHLALGCRVLLGAMRKLAGGASQGKYGNTIETNSLLQNGSR